MGFLDLFKRKSKDADGENVSMWVDFHSHLLPGIDDGCQNVEESLANIKELKQQGISRIITTPHIFNEVYPNNPEIIREKLALVKKALNENKIQMDITATAEYYLDEWFCQNYKNMELLTIAGKYLLVETNYVERPHFLEQILFDLQTSGYRVILAHPERYNYLIYDFNLLETLHNSGVLFQCNLLSFTGYYSKQVKKAAFYLLNNELIDLVGSDIHRMRHTKAISVFKKSKDYKRLLSLKLLNNSL